MLSSVNQNSSVNRFSAVNAFKTNKNVTKPEVQEKQEDVIQGTKTSTAKSLLDKIDVNEIKECAKYVGEFNISDDDIKYGLLYGRSVIAEYLC